MNQLLLIGTPLQNNLAELWSMKELQYDEGTKKILKLEQEKHILASLCEILQSFMLRREKLDVCPDIPPKKELIVYASLTELQHDLYKAVLNRDIQLLSKINEPPSIYTEDGKRKKRSCVLKNLSNTTNNSTEQNSLSSTTPLNDKKLLMWKQYTDVKEHNRDFLINIKVQNRGYCIQRIVNHPYLVHCPLDSSGLPLIDEDVIKSSGKLLVLDAMFTKLKSQGHKILLFSTMTTLLDMIENYLSMRTYKYVRLDGSTNLENRKRYIQAFNTDCNILLFLMSTKAGDIGLNLTAVDTVIIYDSDWNPQVDIQTMARCHRIGQTKPVVIYKLCIKCTVDEAIVNRAEAKRVLEKIVISKKSESININSMKTLIELQSLLESRDCQVLASENEVFTEAELNKLLDRSDLHTNFKSEDPKGVLNSLKKKK
ncbi:Lymphoid-specific helicase [Dufourea novaeangliae]|uniref:Lymphoid-specific helicase n=1 Tax=Dufourea novaeangliae TaxID=178035 RepID=A0A154PGR7_DUFNO|nr:Lymphoid-specific helicase [Dufourea novaeangliae]